MSSNNDTDYSSSESDEDEEEGVGRDDAENQQPLSWRLPPEISHSDWTIETLVNGKIHGSYPVHKNMLSVGTKRSPYFACMFDQQRLPFSESQTRTSRIELNGAAAEAFPPFLDYLYSKSDELAITHHSAAALYHLGQYFGVAALQKRAKRFWKDEMTVENCAIYYDQSKLFANQKLRRAVIEKCADYLCEIDPDYSPIFDASDIGLWLQILQAKQREETGYLSYLISTFCTRHMDEIDAETFVELTNEQYPETALSSLQERCVDALAVAWEYTNTASVATSLNGINFHLLLSVLERANKHARSVTAQRQHAIASHLRKIGQLEEHQMPKQIVVAGAGVQGVDGTYTRTDSFLNGALRFSKDGEWNENPAIFSIHMTSRANSNSDQLYWWIAVKLVVNGTYEFLYWSGKGFSSSSFPPKSGWRVATSGSGPAPTLSFEYGE